MNKGDKVLFDFNSTEASKKWYAINDNVMGGISQSNMVVNIDGTATFKGNVSFVNNGGFASVRTAIDYTCNHEYKGVRLRVNGDGKTYNIRFRTNNNLKGFAYQAKIKTKAGKWQEIKVPFKEFSPTFRGKTLYGKPELEPQNIKQIGFMITDKQPGEFELLLDWIKFYPQY